MAPNSKSTIRSAWSALHPTVAATLAGLACAAVLMAAGKASWTAPVDFNAILMRGLLPFLLFAGALHVDLSALGEEAAFVGLLSTAGVAVATFFVGWALKTALGALGRDVPLLPCLLFGALISPTDPIAVLAVFRRARVPARLSAAVGAESLLNDGFAVIMFLSVLGAAEGHGVSLSRMGLLFLRQTGGGLAAGLLAGALGARLLRLLRPCWRQVAATALLAYGVYAATDACGASGPLAVIVAGMWIGNRARDLVGAWARIDFFLNIAVFCLLGLCAAQVPWTAAPWWAGALAIPIVLAGRAISVLLSMAALRPWRTYVIGTFHALTWGGLRGAIPLALAFSLPPSPERGPILLAAYVVGLFSLIVQASTV